MNHNFTKLKRKMLLKVFTSTFLGALIGLLLLNVFVDGIFQDPFANGFIKLCTYFGFSNGMAHELYQLIFRNNKDILVLSCFIFLILIFFYLGMSRFTRYLNEIGNAVNDVFSESDKVISLSKELAPLEIQLRSIQETLKKRQYEAIEAERKKNDLVIYLAHDLKTPLTSIIGYLTLLSEDAELPQELKAKYSNIALDKAQRLEGLINEFFEITRFNSESVELEYREINLTFLLEQMADEFFPLFEEKGIQFHLEIEKGLVIDGDADKLARVFDNLLRNAINYSYENSPMEIQASRKGEGVSLIFRNKAPLIPANKLASIFQKFYRLDDSRSSKTGVTGLGLAIAKEIVELHGGEISAESSEEATEFRVFLLKNKPWKN